MDAQWCFHVVALVHRREIVGAVRAHWSLRRNSSGRATVCKIPVITLLLFRCLPAPLKAFLLVLSLREELQEKAGA